MSHSESKNQLRLPEQLELADWAGERAAAQIPLMSPEDRRASAVWRQWLSSMASDAEAALAAAIAYREMDARGREDWLDSLAFDAPNVNVPAVALYAPLLAVERDPERRDRLMDALCLDEHTEAPRGELSARIGLGKAGERIYVVSSPLYLNFVQVLACGVKGGCFLWVRHDPIVHLRGVPSPGSILEGAILEDSPPKTVMDELAVAVLSHQRSGQPLPEALEVLGDLLGALGP